MKTGNRDLLVLPKNMFTVQEMEHEIELLNELLYHVECFESFCTANEIIDINKYKIIQKPHLMQKAFKERSKPFVFICNKN